MIQRQFLDPLQLVHRGRGLPVQTLGDQVQKAPQRWRRHLRELLPRADLQGRLGDSVL